MAKSKEQSLEEQGPKDLSIFSAGGGDTGFEDTDSSTFKTPFMRVLQALSPEVKPKTGVPGAAPGKFCNTASHQLYDHIDVVVLKVAHSLIVWQPNRGGFVGRHSKANESNIVARQEGLKKWDDHGNEIVDTIEFFCMNIDDPSDIFILPMSTASLKHAKSWATRIRMLKVDGKAVNVSWAGVWRIGTVEEKNEKGEWYSVGGTPEFSRVITMQEKEEYVDPARALIHSAQADYNKLEPSDSSESPEY